jgi:hypothetical protein
MSIVHAGIHALCTFRRVCMTRISRNKHTIMNGKLIGNTLANFFMCLDITDHIIERCAHQHRQSTM